MNITVYGRLCGFDDRGLWMDTKKKSIVLFVVTSMASYRLQLIFAEYCIAQKRRVIFVYDCPPDEIYTQIEADSTRLGALAFSLDTLISETDQPSLRFGSMPRPLHARIFFILASLQKNAYLYALSCRLAAAQQLLKKLSPEIIIVSEDGVSGAAAIIAAARSLQLPVVDLPYGCGIEQDFEVVLEEKAKNNELIEAKGLRGAIVSLLASFWIKKGKYSGAILFPPDYIIAREALGLTLQDAWIVHGGYANRLLAESEQMMHLYRAQHIKENKIALTGTPYCDLIKVTLQKNAQANAVFRNAEPMDKDHVRILVSWPPSYHASRADKCEFATYEDMSQKILTWLHSLPNCEVTVSLHPAVQGDSRKAIEQLGLNISNEYILTLIPTHDIFVTYYSSTIRWALASGKSVVNYDLYGLRLPLFDFAPSFFDTACFEAFQEKIQSLTISPTLLADCATQQSLVAEHWGIMDGRCMERILDEIDLL